MNILQYTPAYPPSVGGLEFVVRSVARALVELGHDSRILTPQDGPCDDDSELGVVRRPSLWEQMDAIGWADVVVCHQDCLRLAWIMPLSRKPKLMMINVTPQRRRWPWKVLMRYIVSKCRMQASSRFLAAEVEEMFRVPCGVLPNPYDPRHFCQPPELTKRDIDFAFVGRLVRLKGADVFVEGLARLAVQGIQPKVAIVGDGEEHRNLECLLKEHSLDNHVAMLGPLNGERVAEVLRRTYCLVVPSRYEPFGIVALEGRACGCELLVTATGGLLEAAGSRATAVPPGDVDALADGLLQMLNARRARKTPCAHNSEFDPHLQKHEPRNVAIAYLAALGFRSE